MRWSIFVSLSLYGLLSADATKNTRWSRQVGGTGLPLTRERRQFHTNDWIPLTQPCITCKPLADQLDVGTKFQDFGLLPPKPPVTRQIHNTGVFPNQINDDAAGLLQAPPPPLHQQRQTQFFNTPNLLQFPRPNIFQQQSFFPQPFLNDFGQPFLFQQQQQQQPNFVLTPQIQQQQQQQQQQPGPPPPPPAPVKQLESNEFKNNKQEQKKPQNIQLEQNRQQISNLPPPPSQPHAGFQFFQQPDLIPAINQFVAPSQANLTNTPQLPEIPGLDKEEIQLLYVPVETLKQRGHFIEQKAKQTDTQRFGNFAHQNVNFNLPQFTLPSTQQPQGHFVTHSLAPQRVETTPPTTRISQTTSNTILNQPEQVVEIQPRPIQNNPYLTTPQYKEDIRTFNENLLPPTSTSADFQFNQFSPETQQEQQFEQPKEIFRERHRFNQHPTTDVTTQSSITTTTLAPNQPPLNVFMGDINGEVRILDVLRALRDAKTIPVIDSISRNSPKVFVGPANLPTPDGYSRFELPYLSSLDSNRVERRVEKLPFFVAPLNFSPPPGYSKIPFPSPHVGSVVVATESAMRAALQHEKATTEPDEPSKLPAVSPELPGLINDLEISRIPANNHETTSPLPEETTTARDIPKRGRRPNTNRQSGRRPIPNSRLRTTTQENRDENKDETTEKQTTQYQFPKRGNSLSRRQRLRTTTDKFEEPSQQPTESAAFESSHSPQPSYPEQTERIDTFGDQYLKEVTPKSEQPVYQHQNYEQQHQQQQQPLSHLQEFPQQYPQEYQQHNYQTFDPQNHQQNYQTFEQQGQFEVQPQQNVYVDNNGNFGHQHQPELPFSDIPSTPAPVSSTQFFEHNNTPSTTESNVDNIRFTEYSPSYEQTEEPPKEEKRKHSSRYNAATVSLPNVPGIKSHPNPSSVKVKSSVRSRPRGSHNYQTSKQTTPATPTTKETVYDDDEHTSVTVDRYNSQIVEPTQDSEEQTDTDVQNFEVTKTDSENPEPTTKTKSKKYDLFNRTRKPFIRSSTTPTSTSTTERLTTTIKTRPRNVYDRKRPRRPYGSSTTSESYPSGSDSNYGKKGTRGNYSPTGVSNDVEEDNPTRYEQKTVRPRHYRKKPTTDSTEKSTYQTRKDDFQEDNAPSQNRVTETKSEKYPEWSPSESSKDVSNVEFTTFSNEHEEEHEEKKKNLDSKKVVDSDADKKNARKKIRVRVHKRPHDHIETAESQNVGTVANVLVPPTEPSKTNSEPDIYQFSKSIDGFDFSKTGKFIGTKYSQHVRNITSDILESTNSFSSPGEEDKDLTKVTIAKVTPEMGTESDAEVDVTTEISSLEVKDDVETTTEFAEDNTTVLPDVEVTTTSFPTATISSEKIVKTSTTTKVSHETEICYRGKCIKTDPEHSEKDLKKLIRQSSDLDVNKGPQS